MIVTPASTNFAGIASIRFLLGATEAVVNPGFVLVSVCLLRLRCVQEVLQDKRAHTMRQVLGIWWRADEQPIRLVTYYCMNGVAGIFGGLLGYAIVCVH